MDVRLKQVLVVAVAASGLLFGVVQPATGVSGQPAKTTTKINFEIGSAPCTFDQTVPLGEEYASRGVHFQGPASGEGGAILNQCGTFGVDARSGDQFLAFSTGTYALDPETITFDKSVKQVVCWVANGSADPSTFVLVAMRHGKEVARKTVDPQIVGYTKLAVSFAKGFDSVALSGTTPDGSYVVDDLAFTRKG